jgi:hypothetical protein
VAGPGPFADWRLLDDCNRIAAAPTRVALSRIDRPGGPSRKAPGASQIKARILWSTMSSPANCLHPNDRWRLRASRSTSMAGSERRRTPNCRSRNRAALSASRSTRGVAIGPRTLTGRNAVRQCASSAPLFQDQCQTDPRPADHPRQAEPATGNSVARAPSNRAGSARGGTISVDCQAWATHRRHGRIGHHPTSAAGVP